MASILINTNNYNNYFNILSVNSLEINKSAEFSLLSLGQQESHQHQMGWAGLAGLVWVGGEGIMSVVVVHCTTSSSQNYQNTSPVNQRSRTGGTPLLL